MKSRLVLGAAAYGKLTQARVNILLETAQECGITRIDTAHGYEGSEERIGIFLKTNDNFQINTKVGRPDRSVFTPYGIRVSVENSLQRLGVERIETLFVHSLEAKYLTEENIAAMVSLKQQGKINRIGYSGDGSDLSSAVDTASFDDFLMTFNIIDQANSRVISRISPSSRIYYKLAKAQAIWTTTEWHRRLKSNRSIRNFFKKPPVPDSWSDYQNRFHRLKSEIDDKDYPAAFLRFALFRGSGKQFIVLGTHNPQHIRSAVKVEQEELGHTPLEIARYEDLWLQKSSPQWTSHTG